MEPAGLQQVLAAGQVLKIRRGEVPPGQAAVDMRAGAVLPAGLEIQLGLVRRLVEDDAV